MAEPSQENIKDIGIIGSQLVQQQQQTNQLLEESYQSSREPAGALLDFSDGRETFGSSGGSNFSVSNLKTDVTDPLIQFHSSINEVQQIRTEAFQTVIMSELRHIYAQLQESGDSTMILFKKAASMINFFRRHPIFASIGVIAAGVKGLASATKDVVFGVKKRKEGWEHIVEAIHEQTYFFRTGKEVDFTNGAEKFNERGVFGNLLAGFRQITGLNKLAETREREKQLFNDSEHGNVLKGTRFQRLGQFLFDAFDERMALLLRRSTREQSPFNTGNGTEQSGLSEEQKQFLSELEEARKTRGKQMKSIVGVADQVQKTFGVDAGAQFQAAKNRVNESIISPLASAKNTMKNRTVRQWRNFRGNVSEFFDRQKKRGKSLIGELKDIGKYTQETAELTKRQIFLSRLRFVLGSVLKVGLSAISGPLGKIAVAVVGIASLLGINEKNKNQQATVLPGQLINGTETGKQFKNFLPTYSGNDDLQQAKSLYLGTRNLFLGQKERGADAIQTRQGYNMRRFKDSYLEELNDAQEQFREHIHEKLQNLESNSRISPPRNSTSGESPSEQGGEQKTQTQKLGGIEKNTADLQTLQKQIMANVSQNSGNGNNSFSQQGGNGTPMLMTR